MTTLTINKKSYVVVPRKEYEHLVTKAASKTPPAKKLSLDQGKKLVSKMIDKWSREK